MEKKLTPREIVEQLDKYIVSQDEAKKNVAISLRNRYRRKAIEDSEMRKEITPKNIILMGPTGVGKTEIARRLAKIADSPFLKVEATKYTEVGYVGKDVESMIKDLVGITIRKIKTEKIENLREKFMSQVLEKVAKLIKPYDTLNPDEKGKIIQEIKDGKHAEVEVELEKSKKSDSPVVEVFSAGNSQDEGMQGIIENIMSSFPSGGKAKKIKLKVKDALEYILKDEIEKSIDMESLIPEAVKMTEEDGIIFIDEIDKIAEREGASRGEVSRQGVQRDILPIVEGTTVMTKYGAVKTDHILFVAAGAFTLSSPSDLMPELQGRFPVKVKLKSLEKEDFIKILTAVEYNLIQQYKLLLGSDDVEIDFTPGAIDRISEVAIELNESVENIGARRLAAVVETVLKDIMFEAPYEDKKKIKIGKRDIDKIFKSDAEEENLDNYIL
ncbi:ATP-dependent protease ATPase subunit HslU [Ilyobacter polytropus]|uniref:Heat shock protein HslVU, ATPase subunit HslU n=1 Tax=Ilyobacter polytropus (strain ATCC 51220 / DSM 2926 / LMG 16218 / CuHBu1) TaxID=572544 RepID=E3H7H2_ILYPC|nr:ATP-dependent protease ATPase subunit HslU [Ilyobacter polytropus]ADO82868.1 heat shock protein HslVU, ATPase subunit HslU [Ilyobacter polytropus DSM 2926]